MKIKGFFAALAIAICVNFSAPNETNAAVSFGHLQNTALGQFLTSQGGALLGGGVTVGYFAAAVPTLAEWNFLATRSISEAYATLINPAGLYQFTDFRNVPGSTQATGFDWTFPQPVGGTIQNIPFTLLTTTTPIFIMAFDQGSLANNFGGSGIWAAVSAADWLKPADLNTKVLALNTVDTAGEIRIGQDAGDNAGKDIRLVAPVPEPSSVLLLSAGLMGLTLLRRRNSHA